VWQWWWWWCHQQCLWGAAACKGANALSSITTATMHAEFEAQSQVLAAASIFGTPLTAAAWKTKPSWGIVAGDDKIINPDLERWYYARAKSRTTEVKGASHSVYESHPKKVATVIADAARNAQK
jgi:pimeloyl-ACP methyl ester carboxylesterase